MYGRIHFPVHEFINEESDLAAALRLSVLFMEYLLELVTFHYRLPVEIEAGRMPVSASRLSAVPLQGHVDIPIRVTYAERDALVVEQVMGQALG